MKKIIDGTNAVLGRLASYVAKEALKGDEIIILNCDKVVITGGRKSIQQEFEEKRGRVGSGQTGPKYSRTSEKIVKRTIRGMLPDHRRGRGKAILQKIICYNGTPKEYQNEKPMKVGKDKLNKFITIKEIYNKDGK